MPRQIRDATLDTRNARRGLKMQSEPYWRAMERGLYIGYRRRKTGGSWIVRRFNDAGRYEKKCLGHADDNQDCDGIKTLDYKQALEAAREWYHKAVRIEAGQEDKITGVYTVANAMTDYMTGYEREGKSVQTTQTNIDAHILPALGTIDIAKLSTRRIMEWHQALAKAPKRLRSSRASTALKTSPVSDDPDAIRSRKATANRILTILKAALNTAWKAGTVASDTPWRKVKPFRNVSSARVQHLTPDEAVRLTNACPDDLRWLVQAALLTGCRYSELCRVKTADFHPESGTLLIPASKSGKARYVTLDNEGARLFTIATSGKERNDIVFRHADGRIWGKSHQCRPIREACQRGKIKPAISFHILRHTHGSLLAMEGASMQVIAAQLGHADTRMTEKHYAHLSPSYRADAIRRHFPALGIVQNSNVSQLRLNAHV